jgi:hypothetical protein
MDPELTALTATATTVVQLLATTAWEQAKNAVGELCGGCIRIGLRRCRPSGKRPALSC